EVELVFKIDEGPKLRVGEIVFVGRTKIPASFLQEAMKDNRSHNLLTILPIRMFSRKTNWKKI
ncbi:MAG: hypothetical protein ACPLRA_05925, partial [Candidatus Saccharicenans sp.]